MRLVYQYHAQLEYRAETIGALRTAHSEVDPLGLACVLLFGFPIGTRTVLRGVEAVAPCRPEDGGDDAYRLHPRKRVPTDTEIEELFQQALVREAVNGAPVLMLSGGRDSRLILAGLLRLRIRPRLVLSTGGDSDRSVARLLASHHRLPFREVPSSGFTLSAERARHRALSYSSLEHSWMATAADAARRLSVPITDGIGAGVLPTGFFLKPEPMRHWAEGRLDAIADWCIEHGAGVGVSMHAALRSSGVPLAGLDEARHEFVRMLRGGRHLPNPLGAVSLLHWTGRGIAASAFGLLGRQRTVIAPLFDRDLCEALLAFESEEARRSDWRDRLLASIDGSGIPFSNDAGTSPDRGLFGRLLSKLEWERFLRSAHPMIGSARNAIDDTRGYRRAFQRTALTFLDALQADFGVLGGS